MAHRIKQEMPHSVIYKWDGVSKGLSFDRNNMESLPNDEFGLRNMHWNEDRGAFVFDLEINGKKEAEIELYKASMGPDWSSSFKNNVATLITEDPQAGVYYRENRKEFAGDMAVVDKILAQYSEITHMGDAKEMGLLDDPENIKKICDKFNTEHGTDTYTVDGIKNKSVEEAKEAAAAREASEKARQEYENEEFARVFAENDLSGKPREGESNVIEEELTFDEPPLLRRVEKGYEMTSGEKDRYFRLKGKNSDYLLNIEKASQEGTEIELLVAKEDIGYIVGKHGNSLKEYTQELEKAGGGSHRLHVIEGNLEVEKNPEPVQNEFLHVPEGTVEELPFDKPVAPVTEQEDLFPGEDFEELKKNALALAQKDLEEQLEQAKVSLASVMEKEVRGIENTARIDGYGRYDEPVWRMHMYEKDKATGEEKEYDNFYRVGDDGLSGDELVEKFAPIVAGTEPKGNTYIIETSDKEIICSLTCEAYEQDMSETLCQKTEAFDRGEEYQPVEVTQEVSQEAIQEATAENTEDMDEEEIE